MESTLKVTIDGRNAGREADQLSGKLNRLDNAGEKATGSFDKMKSSLTRLPALFAAIGAGAAVQQITKTAETFQKLEANLVTVTGSLENAQGAFGILEQFAAETPFNLEQVVESFTKLQALGLDPSERSLRSYGNTAAAMGKDMNQMIEAVADASTGEFERLKEFGIKASSEGDKVSFTFKGVTTTIGKNSQEIQEYLLKLGETDFAGAMNRQMDTMGGAISNMGDAYSRMVNEIAEAGVGDLIEGAIRQATGAMEGLTSFISSGIIQDEVQALVNYWLDGFSSVGDSVDQLGNILTNDLGNELQLLGDTGSNAIDLLQRSFLEFPANITAVVQLAVIEYLNYLNELKSAWDSFKNSVEGTYAVLTGDDAAVERLIAERSELAATEAQREQFHDAEIMRILAEREETLAKYQAERDELAKLREERIKAEKAKTEGKTLADFVPTGNTTKADVPAAVEPAAKMVKAELDGLEDTQPETENPFDMLFGTGSFDRLLSDIDQIEDRFKEMLIQLAAEAAKSEIMSMFGMSSSGTFAQDGGGFDWGGLVASFFGGGRASGGPVEAGSMYEVGEFNRPELYHSGGKSYLIPGNKGNVQNMQQAAAGGGRQQVINVTQNLQGVTDSSSFRKSRQAQQAMLHNLVRSAARNV